MVQVHEIDTTLTFGIAQLTHQARRIGWNGRSRTQPETQRLGVVRELRVGHVASVQGKLAIAHIVVHRLTFWTHVKERTLYEYLMFRRNAALAARVQPSLLRQLAALLHIAVCEDRHDVRSLRAQDPERLVT